MKKKFTIGVIALLLLFLATFWGVRGWQYSMLWTAQEALQKQEYGKVRLLTQRLLFYPVNAEIKQRSAYLLAKAYLGDPNLASDKALGQAILLLETIPPSSPDYLDALVVRARQLFLVEYKACASERLLKQVLDRDPKYREANELLFSIYCATNRAEHADGPFWTAFAQVDAAQKPDLFRLWFLSQFTRNLANRQIDVAFGIVAPNQAPSDDDVLNRFIFLKNREPDQALHYGTMASWWLWKTETKVAFEVLEAGQKASKTISEEVYLSILIQALVNQGEFGKAAQFIKQWPEKDRGFNYWRLLGIVQQANDQYELAVSSFKKCAQVWPGPIDANVGFRTAQCLKELGRNEEAAVVEGRTTKIRFWMEDSWASVRGALDFMNDMRAVAKLIEFFEGIGRPEAIDYLKQHLSQLPAGTSVSAESSESSQLTSPN